jgi:hypothetical protein
VDSLQRLRGYTYTCRLRDGTLHLVTPVWGRAPLYSELFFEIEFMMGVPMLLAVGTSDR